MNRFSDFRGFTLIELVIIIVVLGILAAVAIPKYQNISKEAKESACLSALGGLRSGITIFYANQAVQTGTATWPTLAELQGTDVMTNGIPKNPYCPDSAYPDSILDGSSVSKGTTIGSDCGWVYNANTGEIWPNTSVNGENNW